jgi:aspartyl-tRNA(Asn)/glutamyl-tRNA(Gln) amidotransferase subunit C
MTLTAEEVEHIAKLARLAVTPEEREAFSKQLSSILQYVSHLQEIDTTGVEPMSYAIPMENVWAEDEVRTADEANRRALIDAFPEKDGDLLKVKAVFS